MERCINPLIIVIISIQLLSVAGEEVSTMLGQRRKTQSTKGSRYRVTFALCPLPPVPQKVPLSPHHPESAPTKAWLEPKCQASLQMPHISLRNANSSLDHSNKEGFIKNMLAKTKGGSFWNIHASKYYVEIVFIDFTKSSAVLQHAFELQKYILLCLSKWVWLQTSKVQSQEVLRKTLDRKWGTSSAPQLWHVGALAWASVCVSVHTHVFLRHGCVCSSRIFVCSFFRWSKINPICYAAQWIRRFEVIFNWIAPG